MARSDYAHWNEEADLVWWLEEGRHGSEEPPEEPYDGRYDWADDDWDDDEAEYDDEADADGYWQAEDAGMEAALFGDC